MPDRHTSDDSFVLEGKQEGRWHVARREVDAALPLFEYFEVAIEGHAVFVVMQEVRDLW